MGGMSEVYADYVVACVWRVSVCFVCVWSLQKKPVKPPPPQMAFTKAGVEVGHISPQTAHMPVDDGSLPECPLPSLL